MTCLHDRDHRATGDPARPHGATASGRRPSPPARLAIAMVRAYQWAFAGRVSPCRYVPSCSSYALEALEVHGFLRGTGLAVRRLSRCHPWGASGWDPVPERKVKP